MALFVTLDQVKRRLRITSTADDEDLQEMADQAEAHVIDWCSMDAASKDIAAAWDAVTVPKVVVAAVLVQTGELYRFRGDEPDAPPRDGSLAVQVRELLRAYHAPVVA